jgi:hypothetical protein
MPRLPIDYSKSLIYKIVCNDTAITDIYVGSTTDFRKRKTLHKRTCIHSSQNRHHLKVYQFIRENGGWDNWDMVLIEKYPCEDNLELVKRERYWKEELNATLNTNVPSRTKKEWREDNKEYKSEMDRKWRENNIEHKRETDRKWREKNNEFLREKITCECGEIVSREWKRKHIKTKKHINLLSHTPSVVIE